MHPVGQLPSGQLQVPEAPVGQTMNGMQMQQRSKQASNRNSHVQTSKQRRKRQTHTRHPKTIICYQRHKHDAENSRLKYASRGSAYPASSQQLTHLSLCLQRLGLWNERITDDWNRVAQYLLHSHRTISGQYYVVS